MKTGIVNETNKMVHDGLKGQKVTIIKSFFCNGEGHYLTKEIGEIPDMFVDVDEKTQFTFEWNEKTNSYKAKNIGKKKNAKLKKLSEDEIVCILKNISINDCTEEVKKQVMAYAFGEEFMESDDKGDLKDIEGI